MTFARARSGLLLVVAGMLAALAPATAGAQSLLELYEAAHAYDATYLSAKALADSATYRVEQSRALMRPNVAVTAAASRDTVKQPFFDSYNSNTLSAGINARQPLFNRSNSTTIAQAERSLVSSQADLESAEQDLILRISQAYFDVLGAQDTLETTHANKMAIAEQLASAKRNFEVGTATITDAREAQARFDLATAQEIAADNDLVTKRIALNQLVGRKDVVPKQLAVPVVLPVPTVPVEELVTRALREHPAVVRAQVAYDVAVLETEKARAGAYPTLDAVASANGGRSTVAVGFTGPSTGTSIGVQFNLPLFTGFAVQNRVKETLLLEQRSRDDLDTARRSVTQATRQAYYILLSGAAQVKALEAAEVSSQLALEATQVGYRVGIRVNVDVLNAQNQLYATRRDLARARYDVLLDTLRLEQADGHLTLSDIVPINQLLTP
jgi:outer membrane protein